MEMQQRRGLGFLSLVATTYFLVSGGPYGLEELIGKAGWRGAIVALLAAPVLWSLPTALLVGELAAALPEEGGYYAWVRRALGPFWGFQEAWLSLAASVFDMGIYPTLFALYLGRAFPALAVGPWPVALGAAMIAASVAWNLRGSGAVGRSSVVMTVILLGPFVALTGLAAMAPPAAAAPPPAGVALVPGLLVAMWNNMGWDNASTIAGEVDDPQRTYPRAMIASVVLVAVSYVVPLAALSHAGVDAAMLGATGAWVDVGAALGGPALAMAITLGGALSGLGMFNALLLSYSRLPLVLAQDGLFPAALARENPRTGAPVASILACAICWSATLGLGFERLVELDVALYGLALLLEFVALVVLRVREPDLRRPFRVPGGIAGAIALSLGPTALLGLALVDLLRGGHGHGLWLAGVVIALGPIVYVIAQRRARQAPPAV
jgi:amino acid transporter